MRIISKLPELMIQKGLDQKTLAAKTGLSPTTVGKIYRGHFDRIDNHTIKTLMLSGKTLMLRGWAHDL
jgi:DNA-binding Xre family transcriptional regulator